MHLCEMRLSHVRHYEHVSAAVTVIIRVMYKITRSRKQCNTLHELNTHC